MNNPWFKAVASAVLCFGIVGQARAGGGRRTARFKLPARHGVLPYALRVEAPEGMTVHIREASPGRIARYGNGFYTGGLLTFEFGGRARRAGEVRVFTQADRGAPMKSKKVIRVEAGEGGHEIAGRFGRAPGPVSPHLTTVGGNPWKGEVTLGRSVVLESD